MGEHVGSGLSSASVSDSAMLSERSNSVLTIGIVPFEGMRWVQMFFLLVHHLPRHQGLAIRGGMVSWDS